MPPPLLTPPVSVASAALQAHLATLLRLGTAAPNAKPKGLSLAQRLGLVPGPPPPLTPAQWLEVHLRSRERGDSTSGCAICLRPFRSEGQVLLSCSHTFHQHCLASLERFVRQQGGGGPCCPLCRAAAYEKRRIDDAEQLWQHTCAARIQAVWRGRQARRAYRALRRLLPPSHPALRRRWAADALEENSAALVRSVDSREADIDALFAELDASTAAAGALYDELSTRCLQTTSRAGDSDRPGAAAAGQPLTAADSPANGAAQAGRQGAAPLAGPSGGIKAAAQAAGIEQQPDWEAVLARCLERDERPECPICLAALGQLSSSSSSGGGGKRRGQRQAAGGKAGNVGQHSCIAVLSCSHAYHADCLSSCEAFAISSGLAPACPCCRSAYARLDLC